MSLELARRRLGDGADLQVADLASPLPFPDGAFDDVIASLVLHYLEGLGPPQPGPAARELFPDGFRMLATSPSFLFFVLQAD